MCVCAWCSKTLHLLVCVQGVIVAPRVHQRSQRDVHGVRLRDHMLRKFLCVCGSLSLGAVSLLLDLSDKESAFLFWMQGGVPSQFRKSPEIWWYTTVGLHTMQGISDKLRELTHYDHSDLALNQALHVIHDALQGPHQ